MKFVADLFNIFNEQKVIRVNQCGEISGSPGVANPDFLKPDLRAGVSRILIKIPFSARLAVRFEF